MMDSMSDPKQPLPAGQPDVQPVLPRRTQDETGEGWGELSDPPDSDEERYLRERPPHHEG